MFKSLLLIFNVTTNTPVKHIEITYSNLSVNYVPIYFHCNIGYHAVSGELNSRFPQNSMTSSSQKVWPDKIVPYTMKPSLGKRDGVSFATSQSILVCVEAQYVNIMPKT